MISITEGNGSHIICFINSLFVYYLFNLIEVAPVVIAESNRAIAMLVDVAATHWVPVLLSYSANLDTLYDCCSTGATPIQILYFVTYLHLSHAVSAFNLSAYFENAYSSKMDFITLALSLSS